ncbi:MAG: ferredoxin family protein [Candidatus Thorarchaeota archaeon]
MSEVRKPIVPKAPRAREKVLVILQEQCKQCGLCIEFCPKKVLCFDMSKYNRRGYHPVTACDIDSCVNCEFCEWICPDMAIFLAEREEAREAFESGSLERGTHIPEFEKKSSEDSADA